LTGLAILSASILEELLKKFLKWRAGRQLRHGAVSHVDRLLGRHVNDRVYDLLRHIRYSFGAARCSMRGQGRQGDGGR
jgi:hypothetical protein